MTNMAEESKSPYGGLFQNFVRPFPEHHGSAARCISCGISWPMYRRKRRNPSLRHPRNSGWLLRLSSPESAHMMWPSPMPSAFQKRFIVLKTDWNILWLFIFPMLDARKITCSPGDSVSHGIRRGLFCFQSLHKPWILCGHTDHRSLTSFFRSPFCELYSTRS